MGGKSGTTTSSVSIPPEVMARYNAVNAYASDVAKTPFQGYQGQFVAGLTPTQQAGIQATSQYSQAAQPYYSAATGQLLGAQQSALPGISAAYQNVSGAQDIGSQYAQGATQGIGAALQYAQPYQAGATQAAMMGAQGIQPGQLQTAQYMNPYTQAVADTTFQALRQQQQQEMAGQTANAIRSGAFGGDRAALAAANLARQQQLGMAQAMAPIYQQGYGQALQTAQQQQGVQLGAEQANRAAMQNLAAQLQGLGQAGYGQQIGAAQQLAGLGQQQYGQGMGAAAQLAGLAQQGYGMGAATSQALAGLGTGAQQAGLQGAQAQMGAGTLEQQTQQADLTARYQQFLQERGYPFQVAQFLANIAMGTGALSGSTTQTTQPMPFFSDRRVKHDVKEIGKTHDGQPIYSFKYNGDNSTQIGLMAQDVEKKHPEAVGEYGGVKTVDYKKATEGAERKERYEGGLVPASMGGAVTEPGAYGRGGYMIGGDVDPNDLRSILAQQQQSMAPYSQTGLYGRSHAEGQPFGQQGGIVPKEKLHVSKLMVSKDRPQPIQGAGGQLLDAYSQGKKLYSDYKSGKSVWDELTSGTAAPAGQGGVGSDTTAALKESQDKNILDKIFGLSTGGVVPRKNFVKGGTAFSDPYKPYEIGEGQVPEEVLDLEEQPELAKAQTPSQSSGSGLGTLTSLVSLGKTIAGLPFFAKDGGVVPRHGYATDGRVWDPTMNKFVETSEMTPEKIAELNAGDEYSRGMQPSQAPYLRAFERMAREEGAKGVVPTELYRAPERSAYLDLTMPEGAPRAQPYSSGHNFGFAGDFAGITPLSLSKTKMTRGVGEEPTEEGAVRRAAAMSGVTLGADFSNPDPSHVQRTKGSFGSLAPKQGEIINLPPGASGMNLRGEVSPDLQEAAYAKAREVLAAQGVNPESNKGQSMMSGLTDYFRQNQSWLVPMGSFLRGMVQSKSPYLGGALLEGLGTGMEAVGSAQVQQAEIAQKTLGIAAQRFKPIGGGRFYDTLTGETIDENVYRSRLAQMPGMSAYMGGAGLGAGQAAAPSAMPSGQVPGITTPIPVEGGVPTGVKPPEKVEAPVAQTGVAPAAEKQVEEAAVQANIPTVEAKKIYAEADQMPEVIKARKAADEAAILANDPANIASGRAAEYRAQALLALNQWSNMRDHYAAPGLSQLKKKLELETELSPDIVSKKAGAQIEVDQAVTTSKKMDEAASFIQDVPAIEQVENSLINAYTKLDMNRLAGFKADAIGVIKSLPALDGALKEIGYDVDSEGFQGLADAAAKDAITQAFRQIAKEGQGRTTNMQLGESLMTVAEPGRSPAAKYNIVTKQRALRSQNFDRYNDFLNREDKTETWAKFVSKWDKDPDHKIEKYTKDAVNQIPYFAGMTDKDVENLAYKREGDQAPASITPTPSVGAEGVNVPTSLLDQAKDLTRSPDGTKLRNVKTGVIYDAQTGKVISGAQ